MPIRGMEDKRELDKEKLKELAFIDDLTSLYNRRYLYQYLPEELRDIQQTGQELCLFMMDVDNFKGINDTYGHLSGDKILVEIAEILRKGLREEDTIVRYAGDEFVAILPGAKEDVAFNIAKRIIEKINKRLFRGSEGKADISATLSIGLALFPRDAQDPEKLIYQADRALYSSKRSGRNRICTIKEVAKEILDEAKLQEIFPSPQLIGRNNQLNRLQEFLDEAEKGQTKFALIKGAKGIGKTRLINEFKKYAQSKNLTSISISCSPELSNQPYQVLIIAMESLYASLGAEALGKFISTLTQAQTVQLANYIPSLRQFLPEDSRTAKAPSGKQAQEDLFKGICQSLSYIVEKNIFLLLIDDFHWIDKETLQLFNYITKELKAISILVTGAYREDELEKRTDSSSPKELLRRMEQSGLTQEFLLEPLEKGDVLKLITAIFAGINVNPELVDIIYDISAGNPLFTEEVLRSLVNKGLVFYQNGKWYSRKITKVTLPPFLKEAIQKRITELDEETKPVISAAAVIGQVFDFDVLCRLVEKDSGYILEIIDRASKQHLITPESPFQSDKFRFISGAIRDVIYDNLSPEEKQSLHKRLALIEEKLYKDNIDTVAGSLGYHFGKGRDTKKANLYAHMALEKVQGMPTYADAFSFLEDALLKKVEEEEGEEEKQVQPLSEAGLQLVPAMVRSLRLSNMNIQLYPAHSAIRKSFVEETYKLLTALLDKDNILIISTTEGILLINGEAMSEKASREAGADAFAGIMLDHRIKSISFKKNLAKEALGVFLEGLSQKYDELISEGGLSGRLRKNDIAHIRVNEIRFEQAAAKPTKQKTKFEKAMLIDYLIGKVSGSEVDKVEIATELAGEPEKLAQVLQKVAEKAVVEKGRDKIEAQANIIAGSLQKLGDQVLSQTKGGIGQYRRNIAQVLKSLDNNLRSKVIQAQVLSDIGARGNVIKDAVKEFSDEEILETVEGEFLQSQGNLSGTRRLLRGFLADPQHKQSLLTKLKTKLIQLGMQEEELSWVLGERLWENLSLKEKVGRLLSLSSDSYIKLEASKEVNSLISQLSENDQYSEASKIVDKLLGQLADGRSKALRSVTLNDLDKISQTLISKEKYFLLEQIINSLVVRLDREKDPRVYSLVAQTLATICATLIKKQSFIQATGILKEFNLRLEETSKLFSLQKEALKQAKDTIVASPQSVNWLAKLLEQKIEGHHDFWELSKVISEIGAAIVGPLFALSISEGPYADPFKTYALRWSIARVLKDMGGEGLFYLKEKLADKRTEEVKIAMELLGHMQNKNALKYLHPLLKHEDLNVRKEVVITLGKIGGKEAVDLLSECTKDKNGRIRLAAIWALANIATPEVLHILKPFLKDKQLSEEAKKIIRRIVEKR